MSKEAVVAVIERAIEDEEFRRKLLESPDEALSGYDLTPEEAEALKGGDEAKLRAMGLDERLSKPGWRLR
jgi:hypothetical protein